MGLDAFRQVYQCGDIIARFSFGQGHHLIDTVTKIGITCVDFISTPLSYSSELRDHSFLSSLNVIEGGLRSIEIGRSLHLLYTNSPGIDHDAHKLKIFTNILNIGRIALQIFQPIHPIAAYAKLAVCGLDAVSKIAFLFYRFGIDLTIRATVEGTGIAAIIASGGLIMGKLNEHQHIGINLASTGLLLSLTVIANLSARIIFSSYQHLSHNQRALYEWTFTALTSVPITIVGMVGFGISQSILDSVKVLGISVLDLGTTIIFREVYDLYCDLCAGTKSVMSWKDLAAFNHLVAVMIGVTAIVFRTY